MLGEDEDNPSSSNVWMTSQQDLQIICHIAGGEEGKPAPRQRVAQIHDNQVVRLSNRRFVASAAWPAINGFGLAHGHTFVVCRKPVPAASNSPHRLPVWTDAILRRVWEFKRLDNQVSSSATSTGLVVFLLSPGGLTPFWRP